MYSLVTPIANIYKEYNGGEYKRKYTDRGSGKELFLQGNIKNKRKIRIEKSKVIDIYSYASITEKDEEEFVKDKIEKSSTEKLGVIVETVQRAQNIKSILCLQHKNLGNEEIYRKFDISN